MESCAEGCPRQPEDVAGFEPAKAGYAPTLPDFQSGAISHSAIRPRRARWDLNPRTLVMGYTISNRALSTTQALTHRLPYEHIPILLAGPKPAGGMPIYLHAGPA